MSLLDQAWVPIWVCGFYAPLALPDVDSARQFLLRFIEQHPESLIACRIDREHKRWVPVSDALREAHVERLVVRGVDPRPGTEAAYLRQHRPEPGRLELFKTVLGETSIAQFSSHGLGDAMSLNAVREGLIASDAPLLATIDRRAGAPAVLSALAAQCVSRPRDLSRLARSGAAVVAKCVTPSQQQPTPPPATVPDSSLIAVEPGTIVETAHRLSLCDDVRRWRDANAPGVSVAAVFMSAAYFALRAEGLNVAADRFHILVDARRFMPARYRDLTGNLAKGLTLYADVTDPRAVAAETSRVVKSGSAISAMAANMLGAMRYPIASSVSAGAAEPLVLNLSWVPTDEGTRGLPWLDGQRRRSTGGGCYAGPTEFDLSAWPMGDELIVSATFNASAVDPERARRALEAFADIEALLESANSPAA